MTSNHRTIRAIAILAGMIALIAAAASYGHQTELLLSWGVGIYSYAVPLTVDLLAIICSLALHTKGVAKAGRVAAVVMLTLAGGMAVAANVIAGGTVGAKVANGWMVLAYLGAEWVSAKVRQAQPGKPTPTAQEREKRSAAARKAAATRKRNATATKAKANGRTPRPPKPTDVEALEEAFSAPSAPVSPGA